MKSYNNKVRDHLSYKSILSIKDIYEMINHF